MAKRIQFQLEYIIRSSPNILFTFCSSPSAMVQWFADSVDINGEIYSFVWDGNEEFATMIEQKENEFIRYKWQDSADNEFFEFKIQKDEITGDTALIITDFALDCVRLRSRKVSRRN